MRKIYTLFLVFVFAVKGLLGQIVKNQYQSFFNQAYIENPSIPKGVLEAVAYTQSRFNHIVPMGYGSCVGLPQAYGVMGLIADGKNYFRNNLILVSQLSGYSVDDIVNSPEKNIKAYAKAYASMLQKTNSISGKQTFASKQTWVLTQLSELPIDTNVVNNFALNSHLYSVYSFLNKAEYQSVYAFPQHPIDMEEIFGKNNLKILSSDKVIIDKDNQRINNAQGNNYKTNNPNSVQSADYTPAIWNAAASCNYTVGRGGTAISAVTIHDTEGSYAGSISWFQNCSAVVSAHYVIRSSDGQITQMVLEANKAWHVGSENPYTIGLEHEGYQAQTGWYKPAMYASSAALVRDICNSGYGINPLRTYNGPSCSGSTSSCAQGSCVKIKGHQMFPNQTHDDPGPNWDWYTYYKLINNAPTTNSVTAASGTIYDSGGPTGSYQNDERTLTLIQPVGANNITLTFTSFDLETNWDYLFIYDGATVNAPLIGRFTGNTLPGTITSSTGSLLLDFRSDCATTATGWVANYTSTAPTGTGDHTPPTTQSAVSGNWQTHNFTANFTDADNIGGSGLEKSYYQVIDYDGTTWSANATHGFFKDNFDVAISSAWTQKTGTWSVNNQALYQSDTANGNTNIYAALTQNLSNRYLYHFVATIGGGAGGNGRRAGFHFFCDKPDSSNRNNSYFVWFRVDNSRLEIYKVTNNVFGSPTYTATATFTPNQSYDYKVIYDRTNGLIRVYQNNNLIGSWSDPSPLNNGGYISFRSGNARLTVDQLDVYRSRATTENIKVGSSNANDIRYQNPDPQTPAAKIKSICSDTAANLSAIDYNNINVDWTPPQAIDSVRDGLGADINITSSKKSLSANWSASSDVNSGIAKYLFCIGTTPGDSNVVAWTSNMDSLNVTQTGLNLTQGQWYYFSVKAVDGAGLQCIKILSNGQKVDTLSGTTFVNQLTIENVDLKIYPNPVKNIVNIDYVIGQETSINWQITNIIGQTVLQDKFIGAPGKQTQSIDVNSLNSGLYLLRITVNGLQKTVKLIKEGY